MFKRIVFSLTILCYQQLKAQTADVGVALGAASFFGDLGGANNIGRPLMFDYESSLVKPAVGIFYKQHFGRKFSLRAQVFYTEIGGNDKLIEPRYTYAPEWFRKYRNLNFHSQLWEGAVLGEINLFNFSNGAMKNRISPYLFGGIGVFHFDPLTTLNGVTYHLHDYHTEAQGAAGPKQYSLTQVCYPWGGGIKYKLTPYIILGVEYGDRLTTTDYMDDVSTKYPSLAEFQSMFPGDAAKAQTAYELSRRSQELDPGEANGVTTAAGEQRGDPKNNDQYIFSYVVSVAFTLHHSNHGIHLSHYKHSHHKLSCPIFSSFSLR